MPGEVLGLLGDNGAGKSTLIKIVTGVHEPDAGSILFGGQEVGNLSVQRARALGIETVFQERALAEQLSLWRNIFMGTTAQRRGSASSTCAQMRRITADLMGESMGFTSAALTPDTHVTGLSGGERQGLAIVRALHFEADIIILDEPTMGLSLKETDKLLHFVKGISDGRQVGDLHRPQHLPRVLGRRSHRRARPRSRRRGVPDLPLLARGAHRHHARGGRDGAPTPRPTVIARPTPRTPTRRRAS